MNARFRRICIAAVAFVIGLIFLLVLGYSQLFSYLQGNKFRQTLADGIHRASGAATVEINSNLSINGNRISVDGASVTGLKNIKEAKASRISTEINRTALFSRKLHLHKINMEEASLSVTTSSAGHSISSKSASQQEQKRKKSSANKKTDTASESPFNLKDVQLDLFECKDADLNLEHNGELYQILGANITALPAPRIGPGAWQLTAENTRLRTPFRFLRDSSIKSATLVYRNNTADVTECRILLTPGEMRLKAHYSLSKHRWSADMQVNKGDLHRILNDDWKKRVRGDLYGRLTLTGKSSEPVTATGAFSIQNGILEGLPFLSQLPIGNTFPYRSIEIEKADCQIIFPYDSAKIKKAWLFDKISMRSRDGMLLVKGHILIGADRSLGGTLTIGIPKTVTDSLPLAPEELTAELFTAIGNDDAYLWVNMNLSGTIDDPQEDLSIRIATLTGNKLSEMLKQIPKGNAANLLNLLLQQKPQQKEEAATQDSQPTAPTKSGDLINDAANAAGSLLQSLF